MNPILAQIIRERKCPSLDGTTTVNISATSVTETEGSLIQKAVKACQAQISVETGLAYGTSALYICDALRQTPQTQHIVIDPYQHHPEAAWKGLGINNLRLAGYENMVRFMEKPSHLALPQLEAEGVQVDFGFIDGYHTFDHTLLDFFYIDRLLKVGGIVMLDDTNWQSIRKVCSFILKNRNYEVFDYVKANVGLTNLRKMMNKGVNQVANWTKMKNYFEPASSFLGNELDQLTYGGSIAFQKIAHDDRTGNHFVAF